MGLRLAVWQIKTILSLLSIRNRQMF